jgi:hypothetical protein
VLQTEVNKPLTIRLLAASTKTGHWPARLGLSLAGFLALWGLVVAALRVTRRKPVRSDAVA